MKTVFFLTVQLLPVLCLAQMTDSNTISRLTTVSPRLGGVTVTDAVTPMKGSDVQQHIVDFGIPLYKNFTGPHAILIKSGFRYENLLVPNIQPYGSGVFNNFTIPLIASYGITKKTSLTFVGLASFSSDLKESLQTKDLQYTAGIRIGFRPSNNLQYGVTLTYINNYSGRFLLPIPDIDWTINKHLTLSAIVPSRISLKYKLSPAQSIGLTSGYVGNIYSLNNGKTKQYLSWQQYSAGIIYDRSISKRWSFNLIAGHSFMQRLETFDQGAKASLDNFSELSGRKANYSEQQTSFIFQGGISYKF